MSPLHQLLILTRAEPRPSSRSLRIDDEALWIFAEITGGLCKARLDAGRSQDDVARDLPVRSRAISEWETGAIEPTLTHLIQWARELGKRLVLVNSNGEVFNSPLRRRPGEAWVLFQRRGMANHLRNRRLAAGLSQTELGDTVGVSRDTIQRWELVRVPPRPISHIVWAQAHGYTLALGPIHAPTRQTKPVGSGGTY